MTQYLLDTNAIIALLNNPKSTLANRIRLHKPADICLSSVVIYELYYGAFKSQRLKQNVALVDNLQFEVLDFDKEDARFAGEVRALLAKQGKPIGPYDIMIAGQALSRGITLISNNTAEFERITSLKLEDWSI